MIKITPAILTNDKEELTTLVSQYMQHFTTIDIDIQETPLASEETLPFTETFSIVKEIKGIERIAFTWDLKLAHPKEVVEVLIQNPSMYDSIFIYSKADVSFLESIDVKERKIGIAELGSAELKTIEFYTRFPFLQLMTIRSERQGAPFAPKNLEKVTALREMGYTGQVSIDGGVNLMSAKLIRHYEVDKVSVGSYFQQSENLLLDKKKLELALNL